MKEIGAAYHPDVALINIGGVFGMEAPDAARAAQAVGAPLVIPHHYDGQSDAAFLKQLDPRFKERVLAPGQTITL
jgi:L-ascorbate metabolism protein UlaG (beta-lactamase superfamily)